MKSLTPQQQRTVIYIIGCVLALAASGWMTYDLSAKRTENAKRKQEIERKERDAQSAMLPSLEEQTKWAEDENQLKNILLPEQIVPEFMAEVTRIADENGLQRIGLNTEETVIDP